jgi:ribosomal protein L7/L12
MKITIEIEVDHLDRKLSVGETITLSEITSAAGSDLDAVITMLDNLSPAEKVHAIKWVRQQTGAYIREAKKALVLKGWNINQAVEYLRHLGEA